MIVEIETPRPSCRTALDYNEDKVLHGVAELVAYAERTVYSAKGRRSKQREEKLMEHFRADADALAKTMNGVIDWEKPLIEARRG